MTCWDCWSWRSSPARSKPKWQGAALSIDGGDCHRAQGLGLFLAGAILGGTLSRAASASAARAGWKRAACCWRLPSPSAFCWPGWRRRSDWLRLWALSPPGLVLDEAHFKLFRDQGEHRLEELLQPVSALLTPIFFVLMGLKVDLRDFARLGIVGVCDRPDARRHPRQTGLFARCDGTPGQPPRVGIGMIPRGEVGLIFAGIGATLMLPNAAGRKRAGHRHRHFWRRGAHGRRHHSAHTACAKMGAPRRQTFARHLNMIVPATSAVIGLWRAALAADEQTHSHNPGTGGSLGRPA